METETEELIRVEGLYKIYEGNHHLALCDVNFSISSGECFGLLGPNGAGKTTLMGCMLGLLNPDRGTIKIGGLDPSDLAIKEIVGFMPERPSFENWFTARQFIAYHHGLSGRPRSMREEEVEQTLDSVGLSKEARERKITKFSRGMLQRLGLAQSLIGKPKLLFLDEPGSGMDPPGVALLRNLLIELKKIGTTILLNSHHLDEMERVCDRVAFIKGGKIMAIRAPGDGSDYPHILRIRWLSENDFEEKRTKLEAILAEVDASLVDTEGNSIRVAVRDGGMASVVIRKCIESGLDLRSAAPESTSLESLFDEFPDMLNPETSDE